ncbi:acetate kinase [Bordetella sp. H567]|uniref:acetate/propionate family kinase n=1 Tax=Bordetella sp. H567 TaxID=1697043 RepID=UPI00081C864A|nr:acetate/propionate family kinase [Bordetella sp. H567]AOB32538.1 acetate kinase [Bordetella sp. H567]
MADVILVLNAGSSSIKFSAFDAAHASLPLLLRGQVAGLYVQARLTAQDADGKEIASQDWAGKPALEHDGAVAWLVDFLRGHKGNHRLVAVGHRVVHGGERYADAVPVTPEVIAALSRLTPLAPLHQPHNLKPIEAVARVRPDLPQVACFDTAFHRAQPDVAQAFALPPSITERGVRRYGFHGLSYEYIAGALPRFDVQGARGRAVVAHLGNGSSMCALVNGRSVASTMGFTAVDGLPMGTRSGTLDPGVILYLMDELGMDTRAVETLIYKQSGLLGVSGISSDMRALLASDDDRARFAIDLYVYRIGRELGSLAAAAGGIDTLVFTAGIGEHAPAIRERVCRDARWLGVQLDDASNGTHGPRISASSSPVSVWVIPTNEELMIARHTLRVARGERAAEPVTGPDTPRAPS